MNIEQFEDLVDGFGEVPADWPDDIRAEALSFLATSPAAQEIVGEAAVLRDMFQHDRAEKAPSGLSDRIVAAAVAANDAEWHVPAGRPDLYPAALFPHVIAARGWSPSYFVLASCFVVGLGIGVGLRFVPLNGDGHIDFATLFAVVGS